MNDGGHGAKAWLISLGCLLDERAAEEFSLIKRFAFRVEPWDSFTLSEVLRKAVANLLPA